MFFFKRKKIVIDLFTSNVLAFEFAKPNKTIKFLPEWWKALPKQIEERNASVGLLPAPTIKQCNGFVDCFKSGFVIPMWSDLILEIGGLGSPNAGYQFADEVSGIKFHDPMQRGALWPSDKYVHAKIASPWFAACNTSHKWMFVGATWNFETPQDVIIPPAVVEFQVNRGTHINAFFPRSSRAKRVLIQKGQPMVQVIPLSDSDFELQTHLVSQEELYRIAAPSSPNRFLNSYSEKIRAARRGERCPF